MYKTAFHGLFVTDDLLGGWGGGEDMSGIVCPIEIPREAYLLPSLFARLRVPTYMILALRGRLLCLSQCERFIEYFIHQKWL